MASLDVIKRITVQMQTAGFDKAEAQLHAVVEAGGDVRQAAGAMGVALDQAGKSAERTGAQFERAEKRLVGTAREAANLQKGFDLLFKAASTGQFSTERIEAFRNALIESTQAAKDLAAQQKAADTRNLDAATAAMEERVKAAREAQVAEERLNKTLQEQAQARQLAAATSEFEQRVRAAREEQAAEEKLTKTLQEQAEARQLAAATAEFEQRVRAAREEQAAQEKLTRTLQEQAEARQLASATAEFEQRVRAAREEQAAEEQLNKTLQEQATIRQRNVATAEFNRRVQEAAQRQQKDEATANQLNQQFAAADQAMDRHNERLVIYQRLLDSGHIHQEVFNKAVAASAREAENATKGIGMQAFAVQNLGYQLNDVISGLAMGQSPFTILTQQGGQVIQIMQQSGMSVKELGGYLAGLLTVGRVAFGGIAAAAAALGYAVTQQIGAFSDLKAALTGVGAGTGATVSQLNDIAVATSRVGGVSLSTAQEMTAAYAKFGTIGADNLGKLNVLTKDFAFATGQEIPAAVKMLGSALSDPVKGFGQLNEATGAFDAKTRQLVQDLQASGNIMAAQRILIEGVEKSTKGATEAMNPFRKALEWFTTNVSKGVSLTGQDILVKAGFGTTKQQLDDLIVRQEQIQKYGEKYGVDVDAATKALQQQIDVLKQKLNLETQIAFAVARQKQERATSLIAADIAQARVPQLLSSSTTPLLAERRTLQTGIESGTMTPDQTEFAKRQVQGLTDLINQFGASASATERMLAQMNNSFELSINAMKQFNETGTARTAQEMALAQAEQTYQQVLEQTHDTLIATVRSEEAYAMALERSAQAAQSTIRGLQNQTQSQALDRSLVGTDIRTQAVARAGLQAEQTISAPGFNQEFAGAVRNAANDLGKMSAAAQIAATSLQMMRQVGDEMNNLSLQIDKAAGNINEADFIRLQESIKAEQQIRDSGLPAYGAEANQRRAAAEGLADMKIRLAETTGQIDSFGDALASAANKISNTTVDAGSIAGKTLGSGVTLTGLSAVSPASYQGALMMYGEGGFDIMGTGLNAYPVPNQKGLEYLRNRANPNAGATTTSATANDNVASSYTTPFDTTNALPANASQVMPTLDPYSLKNPEVFYGTNTGLYYGAAGSSGAASIPDTLNSQLTTLKSIDQSSQATTDLLREVLSDPGISAPEAAALQKAGLAGLTEEQLRAKYQSSLKPANYPQLAGFSGMYAEGGSFTVPGSGGGDRLYGIGLSAGERVNVTPRGRSATAPGQQIVQYITNYISGGPPTPERGLVSAETAALQIRTMNNRIAA